MSCAQPETFRVISYQSKERGIESIGAKGHIYKQGPPALRLSTDYSSGASRLIFGECKTDAASMVHRRISRKKAAKDGFIRRINH